MQGCHSLRLQRAPLSQLCPLSLSPTCGPMALAPDLQGAELQESSRIKQRSIILPQQMGKLRLGEVTLLPRAQGEAACQSWGWSVPNQASKHTALSPVLSSQRR